ncbi:MAG TPA: hypothetical protein VF407_13860 [Polyangiaceae bacterium]
MKRAGALAFGAWVLVVQPSVARAADPDATSARADDLDAVAARAKEAWTKAGGAIVPITPRFLFDDETASIVLPDAVRNAEGCVTVGLVGTRGLGLHAHFVRGGNHDDDQVGSAAGIAELSSCDAARPTRVVVTAIAGRGALEIVVATSKSALPSIRSIYPERTGGLIPQVPEPGALPPPPAPDKRADAAEARARSEGAAVGARQAFVTDADGSGSLQIQLDAGCHRIELFGTDPRVLGKKGGHLDVDAELRDTDDDAVLARDRSEAPDAHLEACVGGETLGQLFFAGAPPKSPMTLTRVEWPIPDRLPRVWGREVRARMAAALLLRHAPVLADDPVLVVQGPAGVTAVPMKVVPGACYLAVAGIAHGTPRGLGLSAISGEESTADDRGLNDDSGTIAFCARESDRARISVDARGVSLAWVLAVYRVGSHAWSDR